VKKLISLSLASTLAVSLYAGSDVEQEIQSLKAQIKKPQKQVKKNKKKIGKVNKKATEARTMANGNHLKFDVDFRSSYDSIHYKMADDSKKNNHSLLANKLDINMKYDAGDNVRFYGTLAWNKLFGQTLNSQPTNQNNGFDWITNENAQGDNNLRVKQAYWLYRNDTFFGKDVSWTASIGRRPSTDGLLINNRENQERQSALAHTVNVEFDGASFRWNLDKVTPMEGSWFKLCMGRGITNATPRFAQNGADYSNDSTQHDDSNMLGFIYVPYDNGQYSVHTNWALANNLIGADYNGSYYTNEFKDYGDMSWATIAFKADGIGEEISDRLDNTKFFVSWAQSKTKPNGLHGGMLGETTSQLRHSYWMGVETPCF